MIVWRHVPAAVVCLLLASAASAQSAPAGDGDQHVEYLSRFAFHLGATRLSIDDPRFIWDATYGGEVDLVDYQRGRATFYADYEVVLGDQLRAFDPNQGNYILGARVSGRLPFAEVALVFHHESRHLSDRVKLDPVDWNMLGARVSRTFTWPRVTVDARSDIRGVVQHSFVDYRWEVDSAAAWRYALAPRLSLMSEIDVRYLAVDGSRNRGGQTGVRAEGGIRLIGRGASVDLFVTGERRVDPYPLESSVLSWVGAGFRISH